MEKKNSNIHSEAKIHDESYVGDYVTIGNGVDIEKGVHISERAIIYGETIIKEGSFIGQNCILGHPQRKELNAIISKSESEFNSRFTKVKIGKNVIIRAGTIIYSEVCIGDYCQTGHNAMIREMTTIGNHTLIGTNVIIDGNVKIGENVSIQTGVYIPLHSVIGNNVFMGPYSKLTNDKYMMRRDYELKGPKLEDYVSLGANCVILPGVTLKKGTIVGAGAVVTKDTSENDIIYGNPAKFQKKIPNHWKKPN